MKGGSYYLPYDLLKCPRQETGFQTGKLEQVL
jgi:hypothetical protein